MPLEDDPYPGEKPDPADDWKKGYDEKPVKMLDGELFGILGIALLLAAGVAFMLSMSSDRDSANPESYPLMGVLSVVLFSAAVGCAGFSAWKSSRPRSK